MMKRIFDLIISSMLLLIALPILGIACLAILIDSGRPVFFNQERIGRNGVPFCVWKLRTMIVGAAKKGLRATVSHDDARITRVGSCLRRYGIDELPQLLNVLAGDMSLVGPRPTLAYQVRHYDAIQRRRLDVRPGITSLAVVSGRNALPWDERIKLDVWYVDHATLGLDLTILFRTLWKVLVTHEGTYGTSGINDPFVDEPQCGDEEGEST